MKVLVLIPAYKPDAKMVKLCNALHREGMQMVIVNDGSPQEHDLYFQQVSSFAQIVTLPQNCGKGAALKAGMAYIYENCPDCKAFVTADADGQHSISDILRVARAMRNGRRTVLTMRNLTGDIPAKSKAGNAASRIVYTMMTGHYFKDNQSGLRGFCTRDIPWMVKVTGDKYDYELNLLYHMDKLHLPISTLTIETIYIDGNNSSHFHPVKDTAKLYIRLFRRGWVTLASLGIIELAVILLSMLWDMPISLIMLPVLGVLVGFGNALLNKYVAFKDFQYADFLRAAVSTIFRLCIFGLVCFLLHLILPWDWANLAVVFHIAAALLIPAEYFLHKYWG